MANPAVMIGGVLLLLLFIIIGVVVWLLTKETPTPTPTPTPGTGTGAGTGTGTGTGGCGEGGDGAEGDGEGCGSGTQESAKIFDAGTFVSNDDIYYFFKDDKYWSKDEGSDYVLNSRGIFSDTWGGLTETGIDAMVYNKDADPEMYYFFKGDQYWSKERGSDARVSEPQPLSEFGSGDPLPADLDAAVYNSKDEIYYFFKDGKYWSKEYGEDIISGGSVADGWNNGITLPTVLDAVVFNNSSDEQTYYFFKDDKYWIKERSKAITGPRLISADWGEV